jgi:hypothetical protein
VCFAWPGGAMMGRYRQGKTDDKKLRTGRCKVGSAWRMSRYILSQPVGSSQAIMQARTNRASKKPRIVISIGECSVQVSAIDAFPLTTTLYARAVDAMHNHPIHGPILGRSTSDRRLPPS